MKEIVPFGWAIIPDHICVAGSDDALVVLKMPPDAKGSILISCFK